MSKQYKLINLETKEEFICDKVVIEGMDYYVNDDIKSGDVTPYIMCYANNTYEICNTNNGIRESKLGLAKRVIATIIGNSIATPKITDEAYYLSQKASIVDRAKYDLGYMVGFTMAKGKYPFTEDDMIEFAEWLAENASSTLVFSKWLDGELVDRTTKELLDIWQEQRIETIYFK